MRAERAEGIPSSAQGLMVRYFPRFSRTTRDDLQTLTHQLQTDRPEMVKRGWDPGARNGSSQDARGRMRRRKPGRRERCPPPPQSKPAGTRNGGRRSKVPNFGAGVSGFPKVYLSGKRVVYVVPCILKEHELEQGVHPVPGLNDPFGAWPRPRR